MGFCPEGILTVNKCRDHWWHCDVVNMAYELSKTTAPSRVPVTRHGFLKEENELTNRLRLCHLPDGGAWVSKNRCIRPMLNREVE